MVDHSQAVSDAIQDIRQTIQEQKQMSKGPKCRRWFSENSPEMVLVSEIERLQSVLKALAADYYELAKSTVDDPFSPAYEHVLFQLEVVKQAIATSKNHVESFRQAAKFL